MSRTFHLVHAQARQRAIDCVRDAPDGSVVKVGGPARNSSQNSAIHPVVREIAVDAMRPTDEESMRRLRYLLLEQWRAETGRKPMYEASLDGMRMVDVNTGTSDLNKPDCSEFIDWLHAWRANLDRQSLRLSR